MRQRRKRRKRQWELAKGGEGDGQKRTLGCSFLGTATTINNFYVFGFSTHKDAMKVFSQAGIVQ